MRKTKYIVKYTTSFKKDYKRAIKRGLKIELLEQVVALPSYGETCTAVFCFIGNCVPHETKMLRRIALRRSGIYR